MSGVTMRVLKFAALLVAVFAVGIAGVWVGTLIRERSASNRVHEVSAKLPTSLLSPGDAFPNVELSGAAGGRLNTVDAFQERGGIVLFVDLECPPCTDMCLRWQQAVHDGIVDLDQVVGVTYHPIEVSERYRAEHGLEFAIYRDDEGVFRRVFEVTRFPLEVVVGASGQVQSTSYDSVSPVDAARVEQWLRN